VLKPDSLCVSFYSWNRVDEFFAAWRASGFKPIGHIVWRKRYASSSRFLVTDAADRRAHWASVFANRDFVDGFAVKFRPLVASQEVKLLTAAPWGPHP